MNFFKRGMLSITRKKGKSLILLAVIFVLGNLISGAISIQQATGNAESAVKEKLGTAAVIELDHEAFDEVWSTLSDAERQKFTMDNLKPELIKQIGELSYVKYYDFNFTDMLGSKTLQYYHGEDMEDAVMSYSDGDGMEHFSFKGINYAPVLDFEEQKGKLVDGRVFNPEEVENGSTVAIISKKLAEQNNLHVGDTFVMTNQVEYYDEKKQEEQIVESRDLVLEIIGLFEPQTLKENDDSEEDKNNGGMYDFMDIEYQNTIYVPNDVLLSESKFWQDAYMEALRENEPEYAALMEQEDDQFINYTPIYVLNSPEDMEAFEEEVTPLLPDYYTVRKATDHYDSISAPVESMSKLSNYVLIASIAATVLIIGLVVLLFLRDRKRELGIYLSLGERRGRVVGQILIEVIVIAIIGITLSLFSGNYLAQGVSDTMINAENSQSDDDYFMYYGDPLQSDLTVDDVVAAYEVKLDSSYILLFYAVGLATILVSTIIPLIYIVRLNPRKIMM
ncbi:putative ABC transport system permease protein [Evansella caseinilytica]|uniref:Putative ABC transport system permease protein n=1 Tax=Evansella caseinilytica TaxID=1503961 RepID=A0A1H3TEW9_9BACI|nr:ABC transporter permease [Evansella caseinilytica]SDZ48776.1 putative ABC transport system permease protein [Evansella caseinilytica]